MWWLVVFGLVAGAFCQDVKIEERSDIYVPKVMVPQLDGRIVGGWPVNISDHPHQVSLHNWHRHSCGGSLISPNWVLTAAHCVTGGVPQYSFRLGTHFWNSGGILLAASKVISHPQYNGGTYDYDVALVQVSVLQPEVENTIKYAQLPPDGWMPTAGSLATVTGWGFPFSGGSLMDELQEVTVPIVSNESCYEYYTEWSAITGIYVTDRMLCAGFVAGGFDACQGDSGGPMIVDGYLTGIVSWGNGCAFTGYPGVYASVPNLLPWIKEHTGLL